MVAFRTDAERFVVVSQKLVTPTGLVDGALAVEGQRIVELVDRKLDPSAFDRLTKHAVVYDVGALAVLPGVVDTHVHINEPGRTEWEGYQSATHAAAAGGITTLVDMPLNCIPTTISVMRLATKLTALAGKLAVDCGFYGGFVPENVHEIMPLARRGVLGFKSFMVPSGIEDFGHVTAADLDRGLPEIAKAGVPLLVHAEVELPGSPSCGGGALPAPYARYLASRPKEWELAAVKTVIEKSEASRARVHVVHLSTAAAVPHINAARRRGVPISVETCPHYLIFAAEDIADGDTRFKCSPPIRERANQDELWRALKCDEIDFIVSDHSPCTPQLKEMERGDFDKAWGGIAGLQFGLASVWTGAAARGATLCDLARWMAERPAKMVGLYGRKGGLVAGADADLVVFAPDATERVTKEKVLHRHKVTPYEAREFRGRVEATFLRGQLVYERGTFLREAAGTPILRPTTG